MKGRSGEDPNKDGERGRGECPGATQQNGRTLRKYVECVTNYAKEIAFLLVLF